MTEQKENPENLKYIIRVAQVDLPGEKQIRHALTRIKGIGINLAEAFCKAVNIEKSRKAGSLNDKEVELINEVVKNPSGKGIPSWMLNRRKDYDSGEDKHLLTAMLQFHQENDLKRLKKIKTLRGIRHQLGLPVRGQRTKSNFRRGKGKVVGVKKKSIAPAAKKESGGKKESKK